MSTIRNQKPNITELDNEIYDFAPCGFYTTKSNGLIVEVNRSFLKMVGYTKEEIVNLVNWPNLLTMGGKIYYETHFLPLLKMQGQVKEVQFDLKRKNGTRVPVLINAALAISNNKNADLYHFSVLDISQRKLYENELLLAKKKADVLVKKLQSLNTELEQFAYTVSHDLQAPLTSIKGYLQILRLKLESEIDQESRFMFNRIEENTQRMSIFIKELLNYSKLENKTEHHTMVDLNQVWEEVLSTFELSIQENNASIVVPELPVVKGNKIQLIRLFQNLLSNSLKYRSKNDPVIVIEYVKEKEGWKFFFKDNGTGFAQTEANKLFRFFQRLNNNKDKVKGTGIGLAATKKIVELHGGTIKAFSEKDKGTTFVFTIPFNTEEDGQE